MPTYNYICAGCGPFDAVRPIAAFADPTPCPGCAAPAPRQLAGPMLHGSAAPQAMAPGAAKAAHRSGCGCCTPALKPGTATAAATLGAPRSGRPAGSSFLAGS